MNIKTAKNEVFYRPGGSDRIKRMIKGRGVLKYSFIGDGKTFYYWDLMSKKRIAISEEEMLKYGIELPAKCQDFLLEIKRTKRPMTFEEQKDVLLLCSLSIYCWNGNPKGLLPNLPLEEYVQEFYIQMIKYLTFDGASRWNRDKAKYPMFVRWLRLHTLNAINARFDKEAYIRDRTDRLVEAESLTKEDVDYAYRLKH